MARLNLNYCNRINYGSHWGDCSPAACSLGSYPRQVSTGSLGYFGNRESVVDSLQR
jgi:hypothetical protein